MHLFRFFRYVRNGIDLLLAWILWAPTRATAFFSIALGVKMSVLPRFAHRTFNRALRLKFFRTAVEIVVISGLPISNSTLAYLLDQCLARGYFARAALLAPILERQERKMLIERLLYCDQLELAEAVARLDGTSIPEETAAHIANRRHGSSVRERTYASRIRPPHPRGPNTSEEQGQYRYH